VVDGLDEKVDQVVDQRAAAQVNEGGQPGEPRRLGVAAQFIGRLSGDVAAVPFQIVGAKRV
jgi:hypothetical protein